MCPDNKHIKVYNNLNGLVRKSRLEIIIFEFL